jgi:hypothetical protein
MRRRIDYESEHVLPDDPEASFSEAVRRICESKYESDKTIIGLSRLKFECIKWFRNHETILEEVTR